MYFVSVSVSLLVCLCVSVSVSVILSLSLRVRVRVCVSLSVCAICGRPCSCRRVLGSCALQEPLHHFGCQRRVSVRFVFLVLVRWVTTLCGCRLPGRYPDSESAPVSSRDVVAVIVPVSGG